MLDEYQNLILTLNKEKMRKVILALVVLASLASCQGKVETQEATSTDSTSVVVDSAAVAVDSVAVDSATAE